MLLGIAIFRVRRELPYNQANYPVYEEYHIFERLVMMGYFPQEAAEFLKLYDISGNALSAWAQEGYLYWSHPKLKVMVGGRSRQVYSADSALKHAFAKTTDEVDPVRSPW